MEDGEDLFIAFEEAVRNNDSDTLRLFLDSADFSDSTPDDIRYAYYYIVFLCHREDKPDLIRATSDYFSENLIQGTRLETFVFSERPVNIEVFDFYYKNNKRNFVFYLTSLFNIPHEPTIHNVWSVLMQLESVRKEVNLDICQDLLDSLYLLSEEETPYGEVIERLLRDLRSTYATAINKPEHILDPKDFGFDKVPLQEQLYNSLPTRPTDLSYVYKSTNRFQRIKEIAKALAQETYESGQITRGLIPTEEAKIEASTHQMDYYKLPEFFSAYEQKQWEKSLQSRDDICRILGPCHPKMGPYTLDSESTDPCLRYGGCRMMTCVEFEDDEDEDDGSNFWFTGVCNHCSREIPFIHWAFRVALEHGGFQGCYCSKAHAVQECINQGYPLAAKLTERISDILLETGIYDRRWKKFNARKFKARALELGYEFAHYLDTERSSVSLDERVPDLSDDELVIIDPM
jgi:hypothetical protein